MNNIEQMFKDFKCKKCGAELSASVECEFCPVCGKPVHPTPNAKKKRGNGQGSVYRVSTNNWRASVTIGYNGNSPIRRTKSGFKSKTDALEYLQELRLNADRELDMSTVETVYRAFTGSHERSKSTMDCYAAAYNYFGDLRYVPFRCVGIDDWQSVIDECPRGKRTKENIRALISLLYKYAIPRGMVDAELMTFKGEWLKIRDDGTAPKKTGFSNEELEILWKSDNPFAGVILLMCYTGFRLGEFLTVEYKDGCLIGGSKTEAGKNRIVPVSPKVEKFIPNIPHGMTEKDFRAKFYDTLESCGIENENHRLTPHSTRHTFATLLKKAKGNDKDKLAMMGHTSTEMLRYYQDVSIDDLYAIICQL